MGPSLSSTLVAVCLCAAMVTLGWKLLEWHWEEVDRLAAEEEALLLRKAADKRNSMVKSVFISAAQYIGRSAVLSVIHPSNVGKLLALISS